jgi:type IV fimbrial biogenesis protein FimT
MSNQINSPCQPGFSLLEVIVVIGILVLLALVSLPRLHTWQQHSLRKIYMYKVLTLLQFARSQAVMQQGIVTFCPSINGHDCDSRNWNGRKIVKLGEHSISQLEPVVVGSAMDWNSNLGQDQLLAFLPSGMTNGQNGTFTFCQINDGKITQDCSAIIVNLGGRMYLK